MQDTKDSNKWEKVNQSQEIISMDVGEDDEDKHIEHMGDMGETMKERSTDFYQIQTIYETPFK
eukprot:4342415-Ditylum_brightwellii.AAC.1